MARDARRGELLISFDSSLIVLIQPTGYFLSQDCHYKWVQRWRSWSRGPWNKAQVFPRQRRHSGQDRMLFGRIESHRHFGRRQQNQYPFAQIRCFGVLGLCVRGALCYNKHEPAYQKWRVSISWKGKLFSKDHWIICSYFMVLETASWPIKTLSTSRHTSSSVALKHR